MLGCPPWMTTGVVLPADADGVEQQLIKAQALIPAALLTDSGQATELTACAEASYFHLWMNTLQDVGWMAQEANRDGELPPEFWTRVALAADAMEFREFMPYCLGKARRLPRQDIPDLMAAFATLPAALGPDWRQHHQPLAALCDQAAGYFAESDPDNQALIEAGDVPRLRRRAQDSGILDRLGNEFGYLFAEAFNQLFEVVTAEDFPEDRAGHAWAVIATNPFRVVLGGGLLVITRAEVWWRAE